MEQKKIEALDAYKKLVEIGVRPQILASAYGTRQGLFSALRIGTDRKKDEIKWMFVRVIDKMIRDITLLKKELEDLE